MRETIKPMLMQLRNRLSPSNRFRVAAACTVENQANILNTRIVATGRSRLVFEAGVRLCNLSIEMHGNGNLLQVSSDALVEGRIELYGDGNTIRIGRRTHINGAFLGAHNGTSILIGDDCLFSTQIDLRTTDSHSILDESGQRINPDKDIVVADRDWLGLGVTVLKGSRLSSDCIIGARALVAGDIPAHSVAAGVPARVLRQGVSWQG